MKPFLRLILAFFLLPLCIQSFAQTQKKFHEPAGRGELETVKSVVEKGGKIDVLDSNGQTALMWAANGGSLEVVQYLVEHGANINKSAISGCGASLHYAAAGGHLEVARYLLEKGADINGLSQSNHDTPLNWAIAKNHPDVVKFLLEKGADRTILARKKVSAMDLAKKVNNPEIIKLLEGN